MKKFVVPTAVVVAVLLAAGSLSCRDNTSASAADIPRIEVKAAVAPFDAVTVSSPIDGYVATLAVQEGAPVRTGAVVATLTNPAVDRDLAYANAQLLATEAKSRRPTAAPRPRPRDDEAILAGIVRAKQEKLDTYRKLLASGDVSKQEVLDLETDLAATKRQLLAERRQDAAPAAEENPALAQAELERAQADLALAQHRQSLLTIVAPASGTVSRVRVRAGQDVYLRDPLADIVDASTVHVQAQVAPELMRFIHAGAMVDVKLLTIPPRTFREPIAHVEPPSAQGAAIVVNVPNPDRMLQPGTPAVITIQ